MSNTICKIRDFEETLKNARDYCHHEVFESCAFPDYYYDGKLAGLNQALGMFQKTFVDELTEEKSELDDSYVDGYVDGFNFALSMFEKAFVNTLTKAISGKEN